MANRKRIANEYFDYCPYNDGVYCEDRKNCDRCGFRPAVKKERVAAIREKLAEGRLYEWEM